MYAPIVVQLDLGDLSDRITALETGSTDEKLGVIMCLKFVRMNNMYLLANYQVGDPITDENGQPTVWSPLIHSQVQTQLNEIDRLIIALTG